MKKLALTAAMVGLAFAVASPAQATSKKHRTHYAHVTGNAMYPGGNSGEFQGGVLKGPLYNGQDYLGDDPDPNIRSYILRDLTGRYGGGR